MKVPQSLRLFATPWTIQARIQEWVGFPFFRESSQPRDRNPGLLQCRWILYQLSHQGSPRILEWVAYPFCRRSSQPRNQTRVCCIAGHSLPTELSGKPYRSLDNTIWNGRDHFTWTYSKASITNQASLMAQMIKNLPCNVGDPGSFLGSGRSPGEGHGYPLKYSCLENPMVRGAWWARAHGVTKSQTWLSN